MLHPCIPYFRLDILKYSNLFDICVPYFSSLLQYFSPYVSADMRKMAVAFNTTVTALEDELMQLILDGQINARIDSHNKVRLNMQNI